MAVRGPGLTSRDGFADDLLLVDGKVVGTAHPTREEPEREVGDLGRRCRGEHAVLGVW